MQLVHWVQYYPSGAIVTGDNGDKPCHQHIIDPSGAIYPKSIDIMTHRVQYYPLGIDAIGTLGENTVTHRVILRDDDNCAFRAGEAKKKHISYLHRF